MRLRYAPNTVVFAAAGNVDHDAFVALVERGMAGYGGSGESPTPDRPAHTPATVVKTKDTEQAYVLLGAPGLSVRDERRFTLSVLDTILGGGMSSRLFQEVREKRGLAYSVYSFQQGYRDAGLFGVSAGTSPGSVQECVDVIVGELERMAADGPTAAEVTLAKEHLKGSMTLGLESSSGRMMRLGRSEFNLGRTLQIEEIERAYDAVTPGDVLSLARELFVPSALGLCVLGPLDAASISWQRSAA
jgi:predicted Zn-dependent peptidase